MNFSIFVHNRRMQQEIIKPGDYDIVLPIAKPDGIQKSVQIVSDVTEKATSIALMQEKVVGARCFFVENVCVVAVILEPIYLKSERDGYIEEIKTAIENAISGNAIITTDIDVYTKIKAEMTDAQKMALYKKVTERL